MACSAGTLARCSQMPVYRPLMGRFLYSTRVSLLELLHTRHRTCPVMAMGANSKPVRCCLAKQQGPDLSLLSPRLRQEWDYDKNQHLNSEHQNNGAWLSILCWSQKCNHALLSEWDHDKNAEQGLLPEDITLRSHKPVHWRTSSVQMQLSGNML
ncbi:hypothetical protein WJX77_001500 [Trebouxia sp. C0004]